MHTQTLQGDLSFGECALCGAPVRTRTIEENIHKTPAKFTSFEGEIEENFVLSYKVVSICDKGCTHSFDTESIDGLLDPS